MENGTASSLRTFKNKFLSLKKSTVWSIRQKYEEELSKSIKKNVIL